MAAVATQPSTGQLPNGGDSRADAQTQTAAVRAGPFARYKTTISYGDLVLVFVKRGHVVPIVVTPGASLQNRWGLYLHDALVGLSYGSQVKSSSRDGGFVHLLHPTAELWTLALPHRTQVTYAHDMAFIMAKLRIVPRSRVIEAGTGSGSFTHTLHRTTRPEGRLYTYEFHEKRFEAAQKEFIEHGLLHAIESTDAGTAAAASLRLTHRDVCRDGFKLPDIAELKADAVFLDLPAPWLAIGHLDAHVDGDGGRPLRLCCFSPCMEQVQRTVACLRSLGWSEISCHEVAHREWEARRVIRKDANEAIDRLRALKRSRTEYELAQATALAAGTKTKRTQPIRQEKLPSKKINGRLREGDEAFEWQDIVRPEASIQSHTSFLLFATKHRAAEVPAPSVHPTQTAEQDSIDQRDLEDLASELLDDDLA